jgi:hypothetical protein
MIGLTANADLPNRKVTIEQLRKLHPLAKASLTSMESNVPPCSQENVAAPSNNSFSWDFPSFIDEIGGWGESNDLQMPGADPVNQSSMKF